MRKGDPVLVDFGDHMLRGTLASDPYDMHLSESGPLRVDVDVIDPDGVPHQWLQIDVSMLRPLDAVTRLGELSG